MSESVAFGEGSLYMYTGSHLDSGNPLAYVQSESLTVRRAWQSQGAVDGTYRAHYTDERAEFSVTVQYLIGDGLPMLMDAATAVHVKFLQYVPNVGSAGYMAYSAVLTDMGHVGSEAGIYQRSFNGFCHVWSAF